MRLAPAEVVRHNDGVLASGLGDEIVLLKPESGACYSLRGVGATVWEASEEACTLGELTSTVCARYDVTADRALDDVERFVGELLSEGLVTCGTHQP